MKQVFDNHEIAHIWAKQSQEFGRTSNRSMYFEGDTIYSYGRHFPIARILSGGIVLFTTRKYSVTTSKHVSTASSAVNHLKHIYTPCPDQSSVSNEVLNWLMDALKSNFEIIANTRTKPATKSQAFTNIKWNIDNADKLFAVLKFQLTRKTYPGLYDFVQRGRTITETGEAKAFLTEFQEKRRLDEIKKAKKAALDAKKRIKQWIAGERVSTNGFPQVYLRIERSKDYDETPISEVVTSMGARVSLDRSKVLFELIKAGRDVKGFDIDGYTVISLNGVLTIGCHQIERSEIDRFAKAMGWI